MYGSNFFNPYMYQSANVFSNIGRTSSIGKMAAGKGLFSNLFKNFSLSGFLSGTSKTLNVINQAIPIYYQVKPMFNNAKTMFKVMHAIKNDDSKQNINSDVNNKEIVNKNHINTANPTFFL